MLEIIQGFFIIMFVISIILLIPSSYCLIYKRLEIYYRFKNNKVKEEIFKKKFKLFFYPFIFSVSYLLIVHIVSFIGRVILNIW